MLRRFPAVAVFFIAILFGIIGCSTSGEQVSQAADEEIPEDFLSRPHFEKPVPRPLGRVLLQWDRIDGADGYEIQMSDVEDFSVVGKAWTVRGLNLELAVTPGKPHWFRIRSFSSTTSSRWSAPLIVEVSG